MAPLSYTPRDQCSSPHARTASWAAFRFPQNSFGWENKKIDSRLRKRLPRPAQAGAGPREQGGTPSVPPGRCGRPLEVSAARLQGNRPTLHPLPANYHLAVDRPRRGQVQPAYPAPPPLTRHAGGSRQIRPSPSPSQPAYPGAPSGRRRKGDGAGREAENRQDGPAYPAAGERNPLRLPPSSGERNHWGNRGEGRLTLSRS